VFISLEYGTEYNIGIHDNPSLEVIYSLLHIKIAFVMKLGAG
jgi:hypothetical protein